MSETPNESATLVVLFLLSSSELVARIILDLLWFVIIVDTTGGLELGFET